jgi:TPR repeat protein
MSRVLLRHLPAFLALAVAGLLLSHFPLVQADDAKPEGKKIALLVGVKKYKKEELSDLKYTENDVNRLAELLRRSGYQRVVVMTQRAGVEDPDLAPTGENIREVLMSLLKNLKPQDSVLLAFSGHGVQFKDGKDHYFCPADARLADPKSLLSLAAVYDELKRCNAGAKVLLVDACRVNPEPEGAKFAAKVERQAQDLIEPPGGVAALFSCSKGEASYESNDLQHGVFFHFVLEGLKGKAVNKKGEVTIEALSAYVKSEVDDWIKDKISVKKSQTPHLRGNLRGNLSLVSNVLAAEVLADWDAFLRSTLVSRDEEFLRAKATTRINAWKEAAEKGSPQAQVLFGDCLLSGIEAEKNAEEALRWYRKAADQNFPLGQNSVGVCYLQGEGVEKDEKEAVAWFKKAADQGQAWGQYNLGTCLEQGLGGELAQPQEAVKWYRKAADQKLAVAQHQLGACYQIGVGVDRNEKAAFSWYRKAADQGLAESQFMLADCYWTGVGVDANQPEAVKWYRKAAEQGHALAQNALAYSYENGEGVAQDAGEAAKWYRKAAEQDVVQAQFNLARCYLNGFGVEKDPKEGVEWLRKAADQNLPEAQHELGHCYIDGLGVDADAKVGVEWLLKSADQNFLDSQYYLGWCHENGVGVDQNLDVAVEWYRKAGDQGHQPSKDALERLGK